MSRAALSLASLVVAAGLVAGPRPAIAATGPDAAVPSEKDVAELQAIHAEAQQRVEAYNATHDASQLAAARELLARWLIHHRTMYGDAPEAASARAPIEQQLGSIEAELVRVGGASPPPVAVTPAPAPPPPRPAMTPEQGKRLNRSRALVAAGATTFVIGGVTLVGASLPLWLLRDRALRRANEQQFYVDELRLVSRARRRHAGAVATLVVGSALAGAGVALLTAGGVIRLQVRRELAVVPEFGRGYAGAVATLRF